MKAHGNLTIDNILSMSMENYAFFDDTEPRNVPNGTFYTENVANRFILPNGAPNRLLLGRTFTRSTPFYYTPNIDSIPEKFQRSWDKRNLLFEKSGLRMNSYFQKTQKDRIEYQFSVQKLDDPNTVLKAAQEDVKMLETINGTKYYTADLYPKLPPMPVATFPPLEAQVQNFQSNLVEPSGMNVFEQSNVNLMPAAEDHAAMLANPEAQIPVVGYA